MKLTLSRARRLTADALKIHGIKADIIGTTWVGQLSKEVHGNGKFRVAKVLLRAPGAAGYTVKYATMSDDGSARIH